MSTNMKLSLRSLLSSPGPGAEIKTQKPNVWDRKSIAVSFHLFCSQRVNMPGPKIGTSRDGEQT